MSICNIIFIKSICIIMVKFKKYIIQRVKMIETLFKSTSYKDLTSQQVKQLTQYLQDQKIEFNLVANLSCIDFEPRLPQNIFNKLVQFTLFSLKNYTFSSLKIHKNHIEFEAGFGEENFGSICSIPYHGIFQISLDDSIIFINPISTIQDCKKEENQQQRSLNSLKLNI